MNHLPELYACVYVRELPAQALLRLRPALMEKPCVVLEGEAPAQTVCSLNTRARLLGLRQGMTKVEVETFEEVVVMLRSLKAESAVRSVLLECAGAFSPRLEDRSVNGLFICAVDVSGTEGLFGPPQMLSKSLRQRIRSVGIVASVTVSANLRTAICLARGLKQGVAIQVVPRGIEAQALAALPVSVLDITTSQAEIFNVWGIRNVAALAALPEHSLIARLGQDAKRLLQLAHGTRPHLFQPIDIPFVLEEQIELDFPLDDLESLLFGLSTMLEQLIVRAKSRVFALASVTITLRLDGGDTHERKVNPRVPTNERQMTMPCLFAGWRETSSRTIGEWQVSMTNRYVELHANSAFSFLEGGSQPEALAERAFALEMPAMALMDRNGFYGSARFHKIAEENSIKAHVGAEISVSGLGNRLTPPIWTPHQHLAEPIRLPLLCETREGYQNLCQLITRFKMRETTKQEGAAKLNDLTDFSQGLVCLTGGDEGPLAAALMAGGETEGRRAVERLVRIFGASNVYVEVQRHRERAQEWRNQAAFLRLLVNINAYDFLEEPAAYFSTDENEQRSDDEVVLAGLSNTADEKLTGFALRLVLADHIGIPEENQLDLLAESENVFAPKKPKVVKPKNDGKAKPSAAKATTKKAATIKKAA